jgi:hypothetical protein
VGGPGTQVSGRKEAICMFNMLPDELAHF